MRIIVGSVFLFLIGCTLVPCREETHISPPGPPEVVERWWDDYLAHARPQFAALLVEGSESLRREGKDGEWSDFFEGWGNGTGPIYRACTCLTLPMPEACAARHRETLAHVPPGDQIPDEYAVTHFHSDKEATNVWRQAASRLGYRDNKD